MHLSEITTHPQDRLVPVGSSVNLICTSSVSSDVTFSWTRDDDNITKRISLRGNTSMLTIVPFRIKNAGNYVCTVRSGSLSVMSDPANLTAYGMYVVYFVNAVFMQL